MKTISIDRWNQAFYEEKMWTPRTTGGTDRNDATPTVLIVYRVTTKGNGDAFISKDVHTTLSGGGGMPGQGYPCIMAVEDAES